MCRSAQGFVIIFDFTRKETFENIRVWLNQLQVHSSMENPPILIMGNKRDIEESLQVTDQDIHEF